MANKKISEFPITTSLSGNDVFLINHLSSTSTVSFSTVSNTISQTVSTSITNSLTGDTVIEKLSGNFIKIPTTALSGQVLTYNGTTSTWVASAASSGNSVGNSQTYQDVTSSRSKDTTYTNSTSRPILVCVSGGVTTGANCTMIYKVNGLIIGDGTGDSTNGGANYPFSFIVPVGSSYRVEGTRNIGRWVELH